jgi:hypothetical protein
LRGVLVGVAAFIPLQPLPAIHAVTLFSIFHTQNSVIKGKSSNFVIENRALVAGWLARRLANQKSYI